MSRFTRRTAILGLAALTLSACAAPLVDEAMQQQITVRTVAVDVSQYKGLKGRSLSISPDRLKADMQDALALQLQPMPSGNTDVSVVVTNVALVSPGQAAFIGGNSTIKATVSARGADGAVVLAPTEITTASEQLRLGGLVGAMMTPKAEDDYRFTVSGFAKAVRKRLLGKEPLKVVSN
ncbi:hypothetical protein ACN2XU_17315 [Primorskyibacter sp. 2E107]|uniref:hypothetical protein n=1 Tax=Primorskyibacter sp. 2E107 TaxID=3403458 RepID=UPI003AF45975